MILQALKEYYDRKAADPDAEMAPEGFEWKEIPYVITLSREGMPVNILCTYEGDAKSRRARRYLVPKAVKKTSGVASNLLWDNLEYTTGQLQKGKPERVKEQHKSFADRLKDLGEIQDEGIIAIKKFLCRENKIELLQMHEKWRELKESTVSVSFSLMGDEGLISDRIAVVEAIRTSVSISTVGCTSVCLVSGSKRPIERLHTSIKGVRGAQSSGANIISFNLDAFSSYGKKQGENAPVGTAEVFAYTTALNSLLTKDSRQKLSVGDATTVFWAERSNDLEDAIVDIFGEPPKDNPDRGIKAIKSVFKAAEIGITPDDNDKTKFFVLGLAPNASRISIRFWMVTSVAELKLRIIQHFDDLSIVRGSRDPEYLTLFRLLIATAVQGKSENINPKLSGEMMRAVLDGTPYPWSLLQAVVERIRAERDVTYARASVIKAVLNRQARFSNKQIQEEIKMSLDTENRTIGYRLGRLFATLEKIQMEATPGINATIRDRFYGAASGTPIAVFSNLLRLKNHHLAKLDSKGRKIYFEKLLAEIMESISDFPAHLPLPDQGRFAIGYYHQTQQFYTRKDLEQN
jgi:CRISPR-associated protein Csd1